LGYVYEQNEKNLPRSWTVFNGRKKCYRSFARWKF
jgi:hypothetical protein